MPSEVATLQALLARALDPATTEEEARTSALIMVRRARRAGLEIIFAPPGVAPVVERVHVPSWRRGVAGVAADAAERIRREPKIVLDTLDDLFEIVLAAQNARYTKRGTPRKTRAPKKR
jgi:hypothetical protein